MANERRPLTDEEFVAMVGAVYEQVRRTKRNSDYVVNQPQMDKFNEILAYFARKAAEYEGDEIQSISLEPIDECGDLTARFLVFSVNGEEAIQEFCKIISYCSAFDIDSIVPEGICISITVPRVFVEKQS